MEIYYKNVNKYQQIVFQIFLLPFVYDRDDVLCSFTGAIFLPNLYYLNIIIVYYTYEISLQFLERRCAAISLDIGYNPVYLIQV